MNWLQFGRLIHSIYGSSKKLPDLDWIQRQGLLAVKLGQVHALRIDFLDRAKCEHLARLYRRNTTMPAEDFDALLRRNAVPGFFDHFESIDRTPLAAASVGQVHRAVLKGGRKVVIKAIKRNVRAQFTRDVASVRSLFSTITFFYPKLSRVGDPVGILDDIEEYTLSELDLRHEVEGQKTLRDIYEKEKSGFDLSKLHFPEIHTALCNENVMVSDFVDGPSFDELLDASKLDYDQLLELFRIHGFYMFCIGTFHGDIHPGNVLLSGGKISFIDTGYVGHVSVKIRRGLFDFFSALSADDYAGSAAALNRMSEHELTGEVFAKFQKEFVDLYSDFKGAPVSKVSLTRKMMQTIRLGVNSGMKFEKGIFAIIRSLMYLDGMVLRCKPDAVLLRDMARFIGEFQSVMSQQTTAFPR